MMSGFRAPRAKTSPRSPRIPSKTPQGASKTPKRRAKTPPRGPRTLLGAPRNLKKSMVFDDFWFPSPKTRQDVPKKPQDPLQDTRRHLQDVQKTRQDTPKRLQDAPGSLHKCASSLTPTPQLKVTVLVDLNAGIPLDWIRLKLIGAGGIREEIRVSWNFGGKLPG